MKPIELERLYETISSLLHLAPHAVDLPEAPLPSVADLHPSCLPDERQTQRLIQLCEIGFIRGLREALEAIAEDDEGKRPFVDLMLAHVDSIDLRGLMTALERVGEVAT